MATTKRTIYGGLYAHGGITVAYLATKEPYDIPGVGEAMRRASGLSGGRYGKVRLHLHEYVETPDTQCFILAPTGRNIGRGQFEGILRDVFPGCRFVTTWVTDISDPHLILALLIRRMFSR